MNAPRFALIKSAYRPEIVDQLAAGATAVLDQAGAKYEMFEVKGSLELPAAVAFLHQSGGGYDGYVVLGCILKGDTIHDEVIAYTVFPALDELARQHLLPIGNGILTVSDIVQAEERANPARQDRGGEAAHAALAMLDLKRGKAAA